MFTIEGTRGHEIPDPAHANCSPNWWTVWAEDPMTFTAETKEEAFRMVQKWRDRAFYSTSNGRVPTFTFKDKSLEQEYKEFRKANPFRCYDYSHTF